MKDISTISLDNTAFTLEQKTQIQTTNTELASYFIEKTPTNMARVATFRQLMNAYSKDSQQEETPHLSLLTNKLIILYEMISIYALIENPIKK